MENAVVAVPDKEDDGRVQAEDLAMVLMAVAQVAADGAEAVGAPETDEEEALAQGLKEATGHWGEDRRKMTIQETKIRDGEVAA